MKVFRFDAETTRAITQYSSRGLTMSPILRMDGPARVDIMYFAPDGLVGGHETRANQLFLIVHGNGWVRARDHGPIAISAGQAAFWTAGEWHESGTAQGMTAIVVEGAAVDPHGIVPEQMET